MTFKIGWYSTNKHAGRSIVVGWSTSWSTSVIAGQSTSKGRSLRMGQSTHFLSYFQSLPLSLYTRWFQDLLTRGKWWYHFIRLYGMNLQTKEISRKTIMKKSLRKMNGRWADDVRWHVKWMQWSKIQRQLIDYHYGKVTTAMLHRMSLWRSTITMLSWISLC